LQPVPAAGDLLAQPDTNDASELLDGGIGPVVIE
jgi:hypothetical protein